MKHEINILSLTDSNFCGITYIVFWNTSIFTVTISNKREEVHIIICLPIQYFYSYLLVNSSINFNIVPGLVLEKKGSDWQEEGHFRNAAGGAISTWEVWEGL